MMPIDLLSTTKQPESQQTHVAFKPRAGELDFQLLVPIEASPASASEFELKCLHPL